ncbi:NAD-dependent epimerase/dehydratase family protein [Bradyrhizobium yuanmingense]|uniref:NAD-dependent epimerase/dehydratase family protein n=1 Tax=Bradyrhizobium yuanmingense TaxID=108015 RepID=UPI001FED2CF9|nr:NAD-dependent epimerase/dehydratase family protein [Bradyrhizobium yuanmingense]
MRILVLGGSQFLGRAIASRACARGHDVTCAARGVAGPIAAGARFVRIDRDVPTALRRSRVRHSTPWSMSRVIPARSVARSPR